MRTEGHLRLVYGDLKAVRNADNLQDEPLYSRSDQNFTTHSVSTNIEVSEKSYVVFLLEQKTVTSTGHVLWWRD